MIKRNKDLDRRRKKVKCVEQKLGHAVDKLRDMFYADCDNCGEWDPVREHEFCKA